MCGIVGIAGSNLDQGVLNQVEDMTASIKHRGPDDHSTYMSLDKCVALGHARLAIVGGDTGHQPMHYAGSRSLSIVFNGEIYNHGELRQKLEGDHEFATTSDTEVILNGYAENRENIVNDLNGLFAFALYDEKEKKLFMARDRMGQKPLYYANVGGKLFFGSEVKAIASQIETTAKATPEFIEFETTVGSETLFENIKLLEQGETLTYYPEIDKLKIDSYWEFPYDKSPLVGDERVLVKTLEEVLEEAVNVRIPLDQPYGVLLSGGLDSSTLALLASKVRKPDYAFISRFPGMPVQYDEIEYAREVANVIGVELVEVVPTANNFKKYMPDVLFHLDQPMASAALLPAFMIAKEAKEKGMRVMISGIGPDEFLGGYARYPVMNKDIGDIERYVKDADSLSREWEVFSSYLPLMKYFVSGKGVTDIDFNEMSDRYYHLIRRGVSGSDAPKELVKDLFNKTSGLIHQMGFTDSMISLPPLIQLEDKIFSAFGIENRGPFLDYNVVETMFRMPSHMKINPDSTAMKHVLREVARISGVPSKVVERKDKVGFAAPFQKWLAEDLKVWREDLLEGVNLSNFKSKFKLPSRGKYDRETYQQVNLALWLNSLK